VESNDAVLTKILAKLEQLTTANAILQAKVRKELTVLFIAKSHALSLCAANGVTGGCSYA